MKMKFNEHYDKVINKFSEAKGDYVKKAGFIPLPKNGKNFEFWYYENKYDSKDKYFDSTSTNDMNLYGQGYTEVPKWYAASDTEKKNPRSLSEFSKGSKITLSNNNLKSLVGLPQHTNTLVISHNSNLGTLSDLKGQQHDTLTADDTGISSLEGMPTVSVHLDVRDNPMLKSLAGLNIHKNTLRSKNELDKFRGRFKYAGTNISDKEVDAYFNKYNIDAGTDK